MGLGNKRRAFVEEYLTCWNATEAARRVGFSHPNTQGPRLLVNVGIQELIEQRISDLAMSADEVLLRLAKHARGDIGEFVETTSMSWDLAMQKAKEKGITDLIKKIKQKTTYTKDDEEVHQLEIELYDAQAALVQLGKYHGLFNDNVEHSGKIEVEIEYINNPITAPGLSPGASADREEPE